MERRKKKTNKLGLYRQSQNRQNVNFVSALLYQHRAQAGHRNDNRAHPRIRLRFTLRNLNVNPPKTSAANIRKKPVTQIKPTRWAITTSHVVRTREVALSHGPRTCGAFWLFFRPPTALPVVA